MPPADAGRGDGGGDAGGDAGGTNDCTRVAPAWLEAECATTCAHFATEGCDFLEVNSPNPTTPTLFRLYVGSPENPSWQTLCQSQCERVLEETNDQTPCEAEVRDLFDCMAETGTCVTSGDYSYGNVSCDSEKAALKACGRRCNLIPPVCNSSWCSGTVSAGSYSCSYYCSGEDCEESCNF